MDLNRNGGEDKIVLGLRIAETGQQPIVSQDQANSRGRYNGETMAVSLNYITIPSNKMKKGQQFCIQKFVVLNINTFTSNLDPLEGSLIENPICIGTGTTYFKYQKIPEGLIYSEDSNPFYFPFDTQTLNFDILLDAFVLEQTGEKKTALVDSKKFDIKADLYPPKWQKNIKLIDRLVMDVGVVETDLTLKHPIFYRVLTMILSLLVLIILLTLQYIRNLEDFLQIAVALLLGLWGVQQVLVPDYIDFPILVNYVILLLYLYLAVFIAVEIFKKTLGAKKKPAKVIK